MKKFIAVFFVFFVLRSSIFVANTQAQMISDSPSPESSAEPIPEFTPIPTLKPILTESTKEIIGPLEKLLREQKLGPILPFNPIKYAIRSSVAAGVPPNTIVLLLLLPLIATFIAVARHFVGIRGFGILLPASLSIAFLATGPVLGIILFLIVVAFSTSLRLFLRKIKVKLQYLPRMALILWFVVLGVLLLLFSAPFVQIPGLTSVSIFPVLLVVLLAEDFTKIQTGKSIRTAVSLTTETIVLSLISYTILTIEPLQRFALLKPEILLITVATIDFLLGRYTGLRLREYWYYRRLLTK